LKAGLSTLKESPAFFPHISTRHSKTKVRKVLEVAGYNLLTIKLSVDKPFYGTTVKHTDATTTHTYKIIDASGHISETLENLAIDYQVSKTDIASYYFTFAPRRPCC